MKHKWNTSIPRADEFHYGYACEECSALLTDDGIVVEDLDPDFPVGLIATLIVVIGLVICA